jgi:hypothetical protein
MQSLDPCSLHYRRTSFPPTPILPAAFGSIHHFPSIPVLSAPLSNRFLSTLPPVGSHILISSCCCLLRKLPLLQFALNVPGVLRQLSHLSLPSIAFLTASNFSPRFLLLYHLPPCLPLCNLTATMPRTITSPLTTTFAASLLRADQ